MNETQRTCVWQNWVFLLENMEVESSLLLDHLREKGVLTAHQMDVVTSQQYRKDKASHLLDILLRKPPNTFHLFLAALEDSNQEHIAQRLRQAFQPSEENPQGREV